MLSEPEVRRLYDKVLGNVIEDLTIAGAEPQTIDLVRTRGVGVIESVSASMFRSSQNMTLWSRLILNIGIGIAYEKVLGIGSK